jgi:hypothetical protein
MKKDSKFECDVCGQTDELAIILDELGYEE